jgi:hypothetical protein
MNCPNCNKKLISEGLKTCPFCGTAIPKSEKDEGKKGISGLGNKNKTVIPYSQMSVRGETPTFRNIEPERPALKKFGNQSPPEPRSDHSSFQNIMQQEEMPANQQQTQQVIVANSSIIPQPEVKSEHDVKEHLDQSPPDIQHQKMTIPTLQKPLTPVTEEDIPISQQQEDNPDQGTIEENQFEEDSHKKTANGRGNKLSRLFSKNKSNSKIGDRTDDSEKRQVSNKRQNLLGHKPKDNENSTIPGEEDIYNTNLDGYYDDLIPQLSHEINKIPQDNIIKAAGIIIFVFIVTILILLYS